MCSPSACPQGRPGAPQVVLARQRHREKACSTRNRLFPPARPPKGTGRCSESAVNLAPRIRAPGGPASASPTLLTSTYPGYTSPCLATLVSETPRSRASLASTTCPLRTTSTLRSPPVPPPRLSPKVPGRGRKVFKVHRLLDRTDWLYQSIGGNTGTCRNRTRSSRWALSARPSS